MKSLEVLHLRDGLFDKLFGHENYSAALSDLPGLTSAACPYELKCKIQGFVGTSSFSEGCQSSLSIYPMLFGSQSEKRSLFQMKPGDRKWCSSPCSMTHGMGKGVQFPFLPLSGGTAGFACYTTCPEKISRPPKTSITGAWWPRVCLPLLLAVAFNFFPTSPSPLAFLLFKCSFFFHIFFLLIPLSTLLLIFFVLICGSSNNFHSLCPYHNLS